MTNTAYAARAAAGFLRSFEFYTRVFVPVAAIGGPATPTYFANMLGRACHMLADYHALAAAKAAAIAADGHGFRTWEFYAQSIVDRRIGRPVTTVWTPEDYAQTVADAAKHRTYAAR